MGYAYSKDSSALCAEDISVNWIWWDFVNGIWVEDPTAKFTCLADYEAAAAAPDDKAAVLRPRAASADGN